MTNLLEAESAQQKLSQSEYRFRLQMELKWLTLIALVFQNTLLVLLMKYSRENSAENLYISSTAVVMSELLKCVVSIVGVVTEDAPSGLTESVQSVIDNINNVDTLKLAVPGVLYTIQNNLLYVAVSDLDAAVYQVTYQLKILTTAVFSVFLLGRTLNKFQIWALFILFGGVSLVQLSQLSGSKEEEQNTRFEFIGLICVLLACLSSAFAGVYMEKVLKSAPKVSLYVRNLQLSIFGIVLGLVIVFMQDGSVVIANGFFFNYNSVTWIVIIVQAGSGFIIASVMKYADNILKGFATAISIILSSILCIFIFDFVITKLFFAGTVLVVASIFIYGYKPPVASKETLLPTKNNSVK